VTKKEYINNLKEIFYKNKNPKIAISQEKYMRNKFKFLGIPAPKRKEIQKPFLKQNLLLPKENLKEIVTILWKETHREFHYFAQELTIKYKKSYTIKDIELFEFMVTHNSWWDTIDIIAPNIIGEYFKLYPENIKIYTKKWINSDNIWLQRSAILFQLRYKQNLDTKLLSEIIVSLSQSKEFFINKAIGWILREYTKTNPDWVLEFVNKIPLHPLSKREALRLLG